MKTLLLAGLLIIGGCGVFAQTGGKAAPTISNQSNAPDGARLFAVNCGRCHRPPDQLSPKIAGSVLRHMRVRAMLSKEDEQAILKYLAP
ncbi:hypothetical protein Acid345_0883 [Candidatus Koribacter versatilis Ellin345]|uniref:Cytochrome c domain-containing protein n=1 Tax=Koribacter versatilis (strain Ellin345) TaxID=204669 RepID=Q1ITB4_KORVE|nr:hypothetical protein Acid345_0883 [Candidatus Koribacter versatilis Ellin345]